MENIFMLPSASVWQINKATITATATATATTITS